MEPSLVGRGRLGSTAPCRATAILTSRAFRPVSSLRASMSVPHPKSGNRIPTYLTAQVSERMHIYWLLLPLCIMCKSIEREINSYHWLHLINLTTPCLRIVGDKVNSNLLCILCCHFCYVNYTLDWVL